MRTKKTHFILILILSLILTGCAARQQEKRPAPPVFDPGQIRHNLDSLDIALAASEILPDRVAIMPFENTTLNKKAYDVVRRSFYNHFASKRYRDIELFEIDEILQKNDLLDPDKFMDVRPCELGRILQADGIIYGTITGYSRMFFGLYSQVSVELEVKLIEASTGEILWAVKHKSSSHEGGVPLDLLSIIPAIVRTGMNIRNIQLVRTTDDLCRKIVAVLPEPCSDHKILHSNS